MLLDEFESRALVLWQPGRGVRKTGRDSRPSKCRPMWWKYQVYS